MSQETETFKIILGRVEHINASHFNCLSFSKASDIVNGINVRLSNMAGLSLYMCLHLQAIGDHSLQSIHVMTRQSISIKPTRLNKCSKSYILKMVKDGTIQQKSMNALCNLR